MWVFKILRTLLVPLTYHGLPRIVYFLNTVSCYNFNKIHIIHEGNPAGYDWYTYNVTTQPDSARALSRGSSAREGEVSCKESHSLSLSSWSGQFLCEYNYNDVLVLQRSKIKQIFVKFWCFPSKSKLPSITLLFLYIYISLLLLRGV